MASFLNESYFSNSTNFKLVLEYEALMNQSENYHTVTYYLYFQSLNGYSGAGAASVGYINGSQIGSTTSLSKNTKLLLGTKTETVYHNNPNSDGTQNVNYSASISCPWGIGSSSVSGTLILPKINRESTWAYTSWQMDDIENPLILKINKYNASYTNKVLIENLQMTEVVKTVNNAVNDMQITFTESELNQIYTLGNNENLTNLRFYLTLFTYDSSGNQIGEKQRTLMNAYLHDANPTFTYSIEETDDKVIDLLESSSADYIIKNVSKPKVSVTATANKGATISTISITNGTQANANENPYIFQDVQTSTFTIVVTDSRGLTSTQTITKNLVNYTPVYINSFSFNRESQVSSNIILNADVTCYSGSFNSITNVPQIFYKVGSSSDYVEITSGFTFSNNKITFSNYNLGSILPYTQSSTLYLYVVDFLTEDVENSVVTKGVATFEAGEHDFQVNGDFFIADTNRENKKEIRDLMYPVGSIYISVIDTNPSTFFGGDWERFAVGKTLVGVDTSQTEFNTVLKTGGSKYLQTHTHTQVAHHHEIAGTVGGPTNFPAYAAMSGASGQDTGNSASVRWAPATLTAQPTINSSGSGNSQNLQPYITVYFWRRTG